METKRSNDGYCFIRGRTKPQQILSALHNIPYKLLPPTLKKVEDFLTNIEIKPEISFVPELSKISTDLKKSMESMERMSKDNDIDFLFSGTIPYIKDISKCDFGQEAINTAKDLNIRDLYYGIEDGLYTFSGSLKGMKSLLNEKGKDLIDDTKYIEYSKYDPKKIERQNNELTKLGSEVYNNKHTDFYTPKTMKIKKELKETIELRKVFDFKSKEYDELSEKVGRLASERDSSQEEGVKTFKEGIRAYWENWWYERYAWDYDEKEKESLKNPYK